MSYKFSYNGQLEKKTKGRGIIRWYSFDGI